MTDSTRKTDEELKVLLELEANATPGDWSIPHFCTHEVNCDCRFVLCDSRMGAVCTITASDEGDDPPLEEARANGALIAKSRNSLRSLILDLQASRETQRELVEALERIFLNDKCPLGQGCDCSQCIARAVLARAEAKEKQP